MGLRFYSTALEVLGHHFLVRLVSEFHHYFSRGENHHPKGVSPFLIWWLTSREGVNMNLHIGRYIAGTKHQAHDFESGQTSHFDMFFLIFTTVSSWAGRRSWAFWVATLNERHWKLHGKSWARTELKHGSSIDHPSW